MADSQTRRTPKPTYTDSTGSKFTTDILTSAGGAFRYAAIVTTDAGLSVWWCGHSHRTEAAAIHCQAWLLQEFERLHEGALERYRNDG